MTDTIIELREWQYNELQAEIEKLRAALALAIEAIERNDSFAVLPQIKTALAKEGK